MDALEEDPFQVEYDEAPIDPTGFRITDDDPEFPLIDQLSWALRKASQHDKRIDEIDDFAKREAARIMKPVQEMLDVNEQWRDDTVSGEKRERTFFLTKLEDWAIEDRATHLDQAQQTVLPSGKVSTTVRQPTITVEDAEAFVGWMLNTTEDDELITPHNSEDGILSWTPKVSVKALRESDLFQIVDDKVIYLPNGEVIPGLGASTLTITPRVVLS